MRIAFLPGSSHLGGAERVLLEVVAALRERVPGAVLGAFCPSEGPLGQRLHALGAHVQVVPLPPGMASLGESDSRTLALHAMLAGPGILAYLRRLRAALGAFRPTLLHTNGLKPHLLGALARPPRARLVWHLHDFLAERPATTRLLRLARPRAHGAIAVSRAVADDARERLGGDLPIRLVPNRVDLGRFHPRGYAAPLAELAGLPPEAPGTIRVGLVATLGLWKGHASFLDALARLPTTTPVRGYVVGGSIYRTRGSEVAVEALRARAAALGLGDRVGFTGFVAEPAEVMRALDVVVHASTQAEPFGLVIAEAMASARAVIVALAGGAGDLVTPDVDGLAFRPGDVDELAGCIARVAADPELRLRLGAAARQRAERQFGTGGLATELLDAYREAGG